MRTRPGTTMLCVIASAVCTLTALATAQDAANLATVIHEVTLIDVEAGRAIPNQTVRILNERVERIDDSASAELPDSARIISGKGLYLMPGLFDAHVHFTPSPETFGPMMLANGVTAVRDTGADTASIIGLRERANRTGAEMPHIICTGAIIDGTPPVWPFSEACDTPEQARAAVQKLKAAGVDMIKVYSLLKPEVYRAAVEEAHAHKLKVTGHVPNAMTLAEALDAGQDCAEHMMGFEKMLNELSGKPLDDRQSIWAGFSGWLNYPDVDKTKLGERLSAVAKTGMMNCPTLVVMQGVSRSAEPDKANTDERMAYVPVTLRAFWGGGDYGEFGKFTAEAFPHMQAMVGELHKAGVPLMIGTDLANPYVFAGFSVHDEMKVFQAAGIPAADVLRSATIIPAQFCEVDDDLGSVAKGKLASLVLLTANPLDDIANASKIHGVLVRGVHYDRAALDGMLKDVRDLVENTTPAAAAVVDMSLPGEPVARGRYVMKFNGQFSAGVEDFVITRDADGYHIRAYSQPEGGWAPPTVVTLNVGDDFAFKTGAMLQMTQKPVEARYEIRDGALHATATIDGEAQEPQMFAMTEASMVTSPVNAGDFAIFGAMRDMKVDEKRELQAVGFGVGGWKAAGVPYVITRKADEELTLDGGAKVNTRHYASTISSHGMEFNVDTWIDERGVMVRSRMRAPFGVIETALSKPPNE